MPIRLNKEQKAAVTHTGSPLLVSAGPGSGKTRVITERVKFLIKNGHAKPSEILCLTFTVKAAEVMKNKLEEDGTDAAEIEISHFHSFFLEILEKNKISTGFGRTNIVDRTSYLVWGMENFDSFGFNKYIETRDRNKQSVGEIIEKIVDGISTFKDELVTPEEIKEFIKKKRSGAWPIADIDEEDYVNDLENLVKVYEKYDQFKKRQNIMDFDDIIGLTHKLLHEKKHVLRQLQDQYKYILVDEFQDNNFAQFEIVKSLVTDGNITAVGDSDQSIYRFQGAYPEIFNDFRKTYPNFTEILLVKNYRNSKSVVKVSGMLLEQDKTRTIKPLVSTKSSKEKVSIQSCGNSFAEAAFVVKKIKDLIKSNQGKISFKDFAVLGRKQKTGRMVAELLTAAGIPANYVGKSMIFSSPSARTLLAYLNFIADPASSVKYIAKILRDYGVSEMNIWKIGREAKTRAYDKNDGDYAFEVLGDLKLSDPKTTAIDQETQIKEIFDMLNEFIQFAKDNPITAVINEVSREHTGIFKKTMSDSFENYVERSILMDFEKSAHDLHVLKPEATVGDYLDFIEALMQFDVETEQGAGWADSVQVSTIYQAKGDEFDYVFVIDVAPTSLPLNYIDKPYYVPKELAKGLFTLATKDERKNFAEKEERRVLYVGMTRAVEKLFVTYPIAYPAGGRRNPSKFIAPLLRNFNVKPYIETPKPFSAKETQPQAGKKMKPIEIKKNEKLEEITKNLESSQYKSALEKIVELEKIKLYKKQNTTAGFDLKKFLNIKPSNTIDKELAGIAIPTIDVSKINLSYTSINEYNYCPQMFKFKRVWSVQPFGGSTTLSRGNIFHKIVESAADPSGLNNSHKLKDLVKILDDGWRITPFLDSTKAEQIQAKKDIKKMLGVYQKWTDSNPNTVIGTEIGFKFSDKATGKIISGFIDRVEKTPQGDYHVIDYKTGNPSDDSMKKRPLRDDVQMNIYCTAVLLGLRDDSGKVIVKPGSLPKKGIQFYPEREGQQFFVYDVTSAQNDKVMSEVMETIQKINDMKFTATPGDPCRWCNYNKTCDDVDVNAFVKR